MLGEPPPAIVAPSDVKFATVVFGNSDAMVALKKRVEQHGAFTSWATVGKPKVFSLWIAVDGPKPTAENQAFIDTVNRKEFGNLSAGFATVRASK